MSVTAILPNLLQLAVFPTTCQLVVWYNQEWQVTTHSTHRSSVILPTHSLIASTYHYLIKHTVSLTKMSARVGVSHRVSRRYGEPCQESRWTSMRGGAKHTHSYKQPSVLRGWEIICVVYNTFVHSIPTCSVHLRQKSRNMWHQPLSKP